MTTPDILSLVQNYDSFKKDVFFVTDKTTLADVTTHCKTNGYTHYCRLVLQNSGYRNSLPKLKKAYSVDSLSQFMSRLTLADMSASLYLVGGGRLDKQTLDLFAETETPVASEIVTMAGTSDFRRLFGGVARGYNTYDAFRSYHTLVYEYLSTLASTSRGNLWKKTVILVSDHETSVNLYKLPDMSSGEVKYLYADLDLIVKPLPEEVLGDRQQLNSPSGILGSLESFVAESRGLGISVADSLLWDTGVENFNQGDRPPVVLEADANLTAMREAGSFETNNGRILIIGVPDQLKSLRLLMEEHYPSVALSSKQVAKNGLMVLGHESGKSLAKFWSGTGNKTSFDSYDLKAIQTELNLLPAPTTVGKVSAYTFPQTRSLKGDFILNVLPSEKPEVRFKTSGNRITTFYAQSFMTGIVASCEQHIRLQAASFLGTNYEQGGDIRLAFLRESYEAHTVKLWNNLQRIYGVAIGGEVTDSYITNTAFSGFFKYLSPPQVVRLKKAINQGHVNEDVLNFQPLVLFYLLRMNATPKNINKKKVTVFNSLKGAVLPKWILTRLTDPALIFSVDTPHPSNAAEAKEAVNRFRYVRDKWGTSDTLVGLIGLDSSYWSNVDWKDIAQLIRFDEYFDRCYARPDYHSTSYWGNLDAKYLADEAITDIFITKRARTLSFSEVNSRAVKENKTSLRAVGTLPTWYDADLQKLNASGLLGARTANVENVAFKKLWEDAHAFILAAPEEKGALSQHKAACHSYYQGLTYFISLMRPRKSRPSHQTPRECFTEVFSYHANDAMYLCCYLFCFFTGQDPTQDFATWAQFLRQIAIWDKEAREYHAYLHRQRDPLPVYSGFREFEVYMQRIIDVARLTYTQPTWHHLGLNKKHNWEGSWGSRQGGYSLDTYSNRNHRDWMEHSAEGFRAASLAANLRFLLYEHPTSIRNRSQKLTEAEKNQVYNFLPGMAEMAEGMGWKLTHLSTASALIAEGKTMSHCVGSYGGHCSGGRSVIYHVDHPEDECNHHKTNWERGSTLEFRFDKPDHRFRWKGGYEPLNVTAPMHTTFRNADTTSAMNKKKAKLIKKWSKLWNSKQAEAWASMYPGLVKLGEQIAREKPKVKKDTGKTVAPKKKLPKTKLAGKAPNSGARSKALTDVRA